MTHDEAKRDLVFRDWLFAVFGGEPGVEKLDPAYVDMLAVAFMAGRNYGHPRLPVVGTELTWKDGCDNLPDEATVVEELGVFHGYIADAPDGTELFLALDPSSLDSWRFEVNRKEKWQG